MGLVYFGNLGTPRDVVERFKRYPTYLLYTGVLGSISNHVYKLFVISYIPDVLASKFRGTKVVTAGKGNNDLYTYTYLQYNYFKYKISFQVFVKFYLLNIQNQMLPCVRNNPKNVHNPLFQSSKTDSVLVPLEAHHFKINSYM